MELSQALAAIKQLIGQGRLEEAYDQLVKILDAYSHFAELAHIARVNQADLYQLKSQTLKGTIAPEDARLATNQLADNALQVIRQLEIGKHSFGEPAQPTPSKAWRYYLAGGIVTLATVAVLWYIFRDKEECPPFSENSELNVMILPFKKTGKEKDIEPEFDIMDNLQKMIDETPGLHNRAIADVHEHYDIDKEYPNSAQVMDIARNCNAQMIVWGKLNQSSGKDYTVDVRYRLLDAGGVRYAGDTTISRLLTVTEEAGWTNDVQAISRLLYLVLANQMRVPIAARILDDISSASIAARDTGRVPAVDTSTSFVLADLYIRKNEPEKAIAEYDKILEYDPANSTALQKRGALMLAKEDYSAAARDLEAVTLHDKQAAPAVRDARIKAYLKSGQPDKAQHEIESAREEGALDGTYLREKSAEVRDSMAAVQDRRDRTERMAAAKPKNNRLRTDAAKLNLGLGDTDRALDLAQDVLKRDPKNLEAVQIATDAHLQKGDTASARKTIESAEKAGANVKSIQVPVIRKLRLPDKKQ